MQILEKKKIVLLGMMTKMPVAGHMWLIAHYLIGFRRLGYDVYYVEAHARTPSMLMKDDTDNSSLLAAKFIDDFMRRFDFEGKWAFHALHDDGSCYGLTELQLKDLYAKADLIINLHGGTMPLEEHSATGRLVYLETDPVELEIELYDNLQTSFEFLKPHTSFFTWGENYGHPDCQVPLPDQICFQRTRAPVVCDLWRSASPSGGSTFTTIGNWKQPCRVVKYRGDVYHWSKHYEYLKFIDLPRRVDQPFELALSSYTPKDKQLLEGNGWRVRHGLDISQDLEPYRDYIQQSRGEFTVAKDQNVRLRSGWFSERSAQYLAAGRPVITQETGFSNVLPTGRGLFGFSTMEDILAAVDAVNSDYAGHCRAAEEIAQEYFDYKVVLGQMMSELGV